MKPRLLLLVCLLLCHTPVYATQLQDLVDAGQLQLGSWLEPAGGIVVGQEVKLVIEVATQRWFAGGTTLRLPDQANLVVLRRDQFATNLSRREGSISWVVQRWSMELYPQAAGDYVLPPVSVGLAVNDASAGVVKGSLVTQPLQFSAGVPASLQAVDRWLATPTLTAEQQLDRELQGLQPGDAITREITLRGSNITAMMLPPVDASAPAGLAAYPEIARLNNKTNRGEASAERRERIVYVVEQPGQYLLPEQVFYWWDTASQEARTSVLPMLQIDAGMAADNTESAYSPAADLAPERFSTPLLALAAIALLLLALIGSKYLPLRSSREQRLLRKIRRALHAGKAAEASRLLYQWLNQFQPGDEWHSLRRSVDQQLSADQLPVIDELLARAYGAVTGNTETSPLVVRLRRASSTLSNLSGLRPPAINLRLNPENTVAEQKESC